MSNEILQKEESMSKKDFQNVALRKIESDTGFQLNFSNFAELEKFAILMSSMKFVAKCLRGNPADCLAVLLQSQRWGLDPIAVASKVYFVNDVMAYEAQLINAVIVSHSILKSRPDIKFEGEGENLKCTVTGHFKGEEQAKTFTSEIKTITTRNSPLWKQQPKQQLAYFALRAWSRIYCPDIIMGVYSKDEAESIEMVDITPKEGASSILDNLNAAIKESDFNNIEFENFLSDIENAPTIGGLQFKYDAAIATFEKAPADKYHADKYHLLVKVHDKREAELKAVISENLAASNSESSEDIKKNLFGKPIVTNGNKQRGYYD